MLQERIIKTLAEHYESAPPPRKILFIYDMQARRFERQQQRRMNDFYNYYDSSTFDAFQIRWLFENRMGREAHPEGDWFHAAWHSPRGIISAYDAD